MTNFGICFSKDFLGNDPLGHIGKKIPVYLKLLELCKDEGWNVYVLTKKTYKGNSVFEGSWLFNENKFTKIEEAVKIDLIYDRTGGIGFPPKNELNLKVFNNHGFKVLCWD